MSARATHYVASLEGLLPNAKLVLMHLAAAHNERTGQCNPSPARLARQTGLPVYQINRMIVILQNGNHITHAGGRFIIHLPANDNKAAVPTDFWPSESAIQTLIERYPHHHFDLREAVHDFIQFTNSNGITVEPTGLDDAFIQNISGILDTRPPGPVEINRRAQRERSESAGALLAGRR